LQLSIALGNGDGTFKSPMLKTLSAQYLSGQGLGVADFDGDGREDIVVLVAGGQAELWKNESAPERHWLNVRLIGSRSNRDGIGARVVVGNQVRTMTTALGYASSSHAGLHFGLGDAEQVDQVRVVWPSGVEGGVVPVKANQTMVIEVPR
jgi:hypothetical protein